MVGDIVVGMVGLVRRLPRLSVVQLPDAVNGINVTSILVAFFGAVILIALLRAVSVAASWYKRDTQMI